MNQIIFYFLLGISFGIILTSVVFYIDYQKQVNEAWETIYGYGYGELENLCKYKLNNYFNDITFNLTRD